MEKERIAPFALNCGICLYHHRKKNTCPECRGPDDNKGHYCIECFIKNCDVIKNSKSGFCYDCLEFSCKRLKNIDERYEIKYHMSMFENHYYIDEYGTDRFLEKDKETWRCVECGGIVTCHGGMCLTCGSEKYKNRGKYAI